MKNLKKMVALGAMVTLIGAASLTAFAGSGYSTPAEVLAALTGKTVETVITEKTETGKTYGTLAEEAGKLTEFKAELTAAKKTQLAERVASGTLTQERADAITAQMLKNQENCDGSGTGNNGERMGAGFGNGQGNGQGQGNMNRGMNGTCTVTE